MTTTTIQPGENHHDSHNPMEQIQNALRRRNEILSRTPSHLGGLNHPTTSATIQADHERTEMNALTGTTTTTSSKTPISPAIDDTPPSSSSLPDASVVAELASRGWEVASDPGSGKLYYFARLTGERRWDNPLLTNKGDEDNKTTKNDGGKSSVSQESSSSSVVTPLADGWSMAKDPTSGRDYYYHAVSKKTSWDLPTVSS